jgi:hypothetical protein
MTDREDSAVEHWPYNQDDHEPSMLMFFLIVWIAFIYGCFVRLRRRLPL